MCLSTNDAAVLRKIIEEIQDINAHGEPLEVENMIASACPTTSNEPSQGSGKTKRTKLRWIYVILERRIGSVFNGPHELNRAAKRAAGSGEHVGLKSIEASSLKTMASDAGKDDGGSTD